jgi:hypothetical protein
VTDSQPSQMGGSVWRRTINFQADHVIRPLRTCVRNRSSLVTCIKVIRGIGSAKHACEHSGSSFALTTDKRGDSDSCEWKYTAFVFFAIFCVLYHFFSFYTLELWRNG